MKQTKFINDNGNITPVSFQDDTITDSIKPAVYTLKKSITGFYLEYTQDQFQLPAVIHGKLIHTRSDKILNTYNTKSDSMATLATGNKGAGKTELTRLTANKAITQHNLPVVVVDTPYNDSAFISFIQSLGEVVVIMDEFVKLYEKNEDGTTTSSERNQNSLLSLFDGTTDGKRLILLTENHIHQVNEYFIDRPGRVYYHFHYGKLGEDETKSYLKFMKVSKKITKEIIIYSRSSQEFSFDILQAIAEEYLRYKEPLDTILEDLNVPIVSTYLTTFLADNIKINSIGWEVVHQEEPYEVSNDHFRVNLKDPTNSKHTDYQWVCIDNVVYSDSNNVILEDGDIKAAGRIIRTKVSPDKFKTF